MIFQQPIEKIMNFAQQFYHKLVVEIGDLSVQFNNVTCDFFPRKIVRNSDIYQGLIYKICSFFKYSLLTHTICFFILINEFCIFLVTDKLSLQYEIFFCVRKNKRNCPYFHMSDWENLFFCNRIVFKKSANTSRNYCRFFWLFPRQSLRFCLSRLTKI